MRRVAWSVLAVLGAAPFVACHVQHDGSFEHDAGFIAASASVAVQIGTPPPMATTPRSLPSSSASSSPPIGPPNVTRDR